MGQLIDLKKGDFAKHVNRGEKAIRDGYIIIIPLEHSYAFACDAFREESVRAMHVLRGDALGVAAQVLIPNSKTLPGLVREVTPSMAAIMKKFWPGVLSINMRPQIGLNWNLGDNRELDQISVRVPRPKFVKALLAQTGPLAISSAAFTGRLPIREISKILTLESMTAVTFDSGKLRSGALSTVIAADNSGIRLIRAGSITLAQLQEIAPEVVASS